MARCSNDVGELTLHAAEIQEATDTEQERNGIFRTAVYDPATYNPQTRERQPFANNTIPVNRQEELVEGHKAYASVLDVPGGIDIASV